MNTNDLVYKLAVRAKELADMKLDDLRATAAYDTDTRAEAIRLMREQGLTRGALVELALTEEFIEEFPKEIES